VGVNYKETEHGKTGIKNTKSTVCTGNLPFVSESRKGKVHLETGSSMKHLGYHKLFLETERPKFESTHLLFLHFICLN
jgi:hypothetical protein